MSTEVDVWWDQWPKDRPRPTDSEFKLAEERYKLTTLDPNDDSDWPCGLNFVMATYSRFTWWHFFFPEEKMEWPPLMLTPL